MHDDELRTLIERTATRQCVEQVRALARRSPVTTAQVDELDGGALLWSGPGRYLNRAVGLGTGTGTPAELLDTVAAFYGDRSAPAMVELGAWHADLAEEAARRHAEIRWFRDVFVRELDDVHDRPAPEHPFPIRGVDAGSFEAWRAILAGDAPAGSPARAVSDEFCDAVHHHGDHADQAGHDVDHGNIDLLARDPDTGAPIACGSLHVIDGVGWLGGAATLATHRRRGAQRALIVDRIHRAARAGCRWVAATAVPGRGSARNLLGAGFRLLGTQAVVELPTDR